MKKFLAILLGAVSVTCASVALAGCGEPNYYKLVYESVEGVTYDFNGIKSGADVKEGYTVTFTVTYDEKAQISGETEVKLNDRTLLPNNDGIYSFKMESDSTITVNGVYMLRAYNVNFSKIFEQGETLVENRLHYYDMNGNELASVKCESGETLEFTIDISVYYNLEGENPYTVLANDQVLTAKTNGQGKVYYSLTPMRDTNITVTGLKVDDDFIARKDGDGSYENPYRIKKPVDLYAMADYINSSWHNTQYDYGLAYYRLEEDIDMKGEQLYIIGDATVPEAFFCGNFDGNNKKISNFFIDDTIIEQSGFTNVFMPRMGLFGQTQPGRRMNNVGVVELTPCVIKNLTLENFTMDIHADEYRPQEFYAGAIAGYALGTDITGCSANGNITVYSSNSIPGYVGGLVGYAQSYYFSEQFKRSSQISSSSSNVAIDGRTGLLFMAGGLVGGYGSGEASIPAYILNSSAQGNINGAVYAGGIVGSLLPYASVKNCYGAASSVSAYNRTGIVSGSDSAAHAYAGGIAGYVFNDSIVKDCFADTTVSARATAGASYQHSGGVVGLVAAADSEYVDSAAGLALNSYSQKASGAPDINDAFIKTTLGWSENDWTFGGTYPVVKRGAAASAFTLSVNNDGQNVGGNATTAIGLNKYQPLTAWYTDGGISEYVTADGGNRSYGYFFKDGANYYPVPASYVPCGNETVYAKFADYSGVAGTYYLKTAKSGSGIYITLGADGTLFYANGASQHTSHYTYDGETITLFDCPALVEEVQVGTDEDNNPIMQTFIYAGKATVDGNIIKIYDNKSYTQKLTLDGVKKLDGFVYGAYYDTAFAAGDLVLNADGTGEYNGEAMTYTVSGADITINGNISATLAGDTVTVNGTVYKAYDEFYGGWEVEISTHEKYTFDGKGGWKYSHIQYEKQDGVNHATEVETKTGNYTVSGGVATMTSGGAAYGSAQFGADGFLNITAGAQTRTLYRENSNVGEWKLFFEEAVTLKFNGIGKDGFGTVMVTSSYANEPMEMKYGVVTEGANEYIRIFTDYEMYAQLGFDIQKLTLSGELYSFKHGAYVLNASLCVYDVFKGEWLSKEFGVAEFNGLGKYSLTAEQATGIEVKGSALLGGNEVAYSVDSTGFAGTFIYNDTKYTFSYDGATDNVTVTGNGKTFKMCRYDNWLNIKVADGETVYSFDGYGYLADGGVATAKGATEVEYTYKASADGNTVTLTEQNGGALYGTIEKSGSGYILKKDGSSIQLKIVNVFTGSWVIGGEGGTIVVGDIAADNTASGSYCGENVTFTYVSDKVMSFEVSGKKLYLIKLNVAAGIKQEIALSETPDTKYGFTRCIQQSITLDGAAGEYSNANGSLLLDGFTVSSTGIGTATLTDKDGKRVYNYTINRFNMAVLSVKKVVKFILKPVAAQQDGAYQKDGSWYILVEPDRFYNINAKDGKTEGVTYSFDGTGNIICSDGTVYSYTEVPERDTAKLTYTFELTTSDGKQYVAELSYGSSDYPMEIKEKA